MADKARTRSWIARTFALLSLVLIVAVYLSDYCLRFIANQRLVGTGIQIQSLDLVGIDRNFIYLDHLLFSVGSHRVDAEHLRIEHDWLRLESIDVDIESLSLRENLSSTVSPTTSPKIESMLTVLDRLPPTDFRVGNMRWNRLSNVPLRDIHVRHNEKIELAFRSAAIHFLLAVVHDSEALQFDTLVRNGEQIALQFASLCRSVESELHCNNSGIVNLDSLYDAIHDSQLGRLPTRFWQWQAMEQTFTLDLTLAQERSFQLEDALLKLTNLPPLHIARSDDVDPYVLQVPPLLDLGIASGELRLQSPANWSTSIRYGAVNLDAKVQVVGMNCMLEEEPHCRGTANANAEANHRPDDTDSVEKPSVNIPYFDKAGIQFPFTFEIDNQGMNGTVLENVDLSIDKFMQANFAFDQARLGGLSGSRFAWQWAERQGELFATNSNTRVQAISGSSVKADFLSLQLGEFDLAFGIQTGASMDNTVVLASQWRGIEEESFRLRLPGLDSRGSLALRDKEFHWSTDWYASGVPGSMNQDPLASSNARWSPQTGDYSADWSLHSLSIENTEDLQAKTGLSGFPVTLALGDLSAQGRFNSDGNQGTVSLMNLAGFYDEVFFDGATMMLEFSSTGAAPIVRTSTPAKVDLLDPGIPVRQLRFQLDYRDLVLQLKDASGKVLGGSVRLQDSEFDLAANVHRGDLILDGLQMQDLFDLIDNDNLRGDGVIDGRLPVQLRGQKFTVNGGRLQAREPGGEVFYSGDLPNRKDNLGIDYLNSALSHYRFEELISDIDLDEFGRAFLEMQLKGHNPDFENGRPINVNLSVEDDFMQQMRSFNAVNAVKKSIEQRVLERGANSVKADTP